MREINHTTLVLASQSPRRKELLRQMGFTLEICPADIDESNGHNLEPDDFVKKLSLDKALAVMPKYPDAWVIGADTVVVAKEAILGKPGSETEAVEMLRALSGTEHSVFTGFSLGHHEKDITRTGAVETRVRFKALSNEEILWYAQTKEPYDKAGAYGIQGMGGFMVESITGSYSNVVGLPLCEVMETLKDLGAVRF